MNNPANHLVLFDGICNLCNRAVSFIIDHDKKKLFRFASLQSGIARQIIENNNIPQDTESIIYIRKGVAYTRSDAVLRIARELGGFYRLFATLIIIPRPARDFLYEWVAKNRYRYFGKREHCMIPGKETEDRFLN